MPWYGMGAIERLRTGAADADRSQRHPNPPQTPPPSRREQLFAAAPTLVVVALWAIATAALYCASAGIQRWDIVQMVAIGPAVMLIAGVCWAYEESRFGKGIDVAIITGALVGAIFLVAAVA